MENGAGLRGEVTYYIAIRDDQGGGGGAGKGRIEQASRSRLDGAGWGRIHAVHK